MFDIDWASAGTKCSLSASRYSVNSDGYLAGNGAAAAIHDSNVITPCCFDRREFVTLVTMLRQMLLCTGLSALAFLGCAEPEELSTTMQAATVKSYETTSCSTAVVLGLSLQIADEVNCMMPGQLARFEPTATILFSSAAVLPYLDPEAQIALTKAALGTTIRINSAFRTVAQQYLLRRWKDLGRCGITAAALPGRSNHESGRAIDVSNYAAVGSRLRSNGWDDNVAGDEVHFEHLSSPDIRGADVQAFQRLWNRNYPTDLIAEDGDYGPATESRLAKSPGEGFAIGAMCGTPTPPPTGTFPDDVTDDEGGDTGSSDGGCGCRSSDGRGGLLSAVSLVMLVGWMVLRRRQPC